MARDSRITAKQQKNDEFYTLYEYIQKEINSYLEYNPNVFKNKVILCPCDDPEWSNFTKFFAQNFEMLGLKKLICTSYSMNAKKKKYEQYHQMTLFETMFPQYDEKKMLSNGKIFTLSNKNKNIDIEDLQWSYLEGDGDFRSDEVKKLRDEADIIITNPPFSLFREFVSWILEDNKKCLIIGQIEMITYKEIFPEIKNNRLWLGVTCNSEDMVFEVPEGADVNPKDREKAARMGYVGNFTRQGNACWFTNIEHGRRHAPIKLMTMEENKKYSKHKDIREYGYQKYDNYDAIEVKYVDAIPSDYDGIMGVASSFVAKYCPEQFEIIGATQTGCHSEDMVIASYKDFLGYHQDGSLTGRTGSTCGNNPMLERNDGIHDYYMNNKGKQVQSANSRILIRKRCQ